MENQQAEGGCLAQERALHAPEQTPYEAPAGLAQEVAQGHNPLGPCCGNAGVPQVGPAEGGQGSASRTGKVWEPTFRWVQLWFSLRSWRPRRPSKKRGATAADDCAIMQKYVDSVRYVLQQPPLKPSDDTVVREMDPSWGYYMPEHRYNRDQIRFALDLLGEGRTLSAPEESGCVAVQTGPGAWRKDSSRWIYARRLGLKDPSHPR